MTSTNGHPLIPAKILRIFVLFALLVGVSTNVSLPVIAAPFAQQCQPTNGHPLIPMCDGASITYIVREMTGTWNAASGYLNINTRADTDGQRIDYSPTVTMYGNFTVSHRVILTIPNDYGITLLDGMHTLQNGIRYYGEWGNDLGWFHFPPLPKLTLFPVAGERIDLVSKVYANDVVTTHQGTITTVYRTLGRLSTFGALGPGDYWRTSLLEVEGGHVYNYVYGYSALTATTGLLAFWYGTLAPDGVSVTGLEKRQVVP